MSFLRDLYASGKGVWRQAVNRAFAPGVWSSLPTASVDFRGALARTEGTTGVADALRFGRKNTSDTHEWATIAMTGDLYPVSDATFVIADDGDATKQAQFQASGISAGATRTYTLPDKNGTLLLGNTSGTQTLSGSIDLTAANLFFTSDSDFGCFIGGDIEWTAGGEIYLHGYFDFLTDHFYFDGTTVEFYNPGANTFSFSRTAVGAKGIFTTASLTGNRTYTLPDATGTLALTSDLPANLDDLDDVTLTTPSDGDVLTYDSGSSAWVNSAGGGSGYSDEQAQDAVGAMVADGTSVGLTYTDATPSLVANIKIASEAQGDIIYHNGTQWTRLAAGTSGQVLQTQGTGANPTWADAASGGGGLTLLDETTFSAASSVSVDNVFSSTYENYRIVLNITAYSASGFSLMRLRAASTDDTTANAYRSAGRSETNAPGNSSEEFTSTSWHVLYSGGATAQCGGVVDLFRPAVADETIAWITALALMSATGVAHIEWAATHDQNTAYDGFTLIPASGTFTGTCRVYGYQNSP